LLAASLLGAALILARFQASRPTRPALAAQRVLSTNTWSIVAADPASGDVGLAVASCVPEFHADVVAALVPGQGAAATQAQFDLGNRDRVFDLLQAGQPAADIVASLSDPDYDALADRRQYGVVTLRDGQAQTAAFTGAANFAWAGDVQDAGLAVTVQGNFLAGGEVVADAMAAFAADDAAGHNALPDRLLRALEAGSAAGGDARCNDDRARQTATTAAILVARGGDPAYAIERVGSTDAGTPAAPWLALSVVEPPAGANPIVALRAQYDQWRLDNVEALDAAGSSQPGLPLVVAVVIMGAVAVLAWLRLRPPEGP
jgi:uncharacterized Ntn-hydrolase superfamily protein